jgi:SIR2-like domain
MYLDTGSDSMLEHALSSAGRDPQVDVCRWKPLRGQEVDAPYSGVFDRDQSYRPEDPKKPLVYRLFGQLQKPESSVGSRQQVITEDDYFDYLIGVTSNRDLIPPVVRRALADSALLFLGFRIDDWSFRVLFRSIMSGGGVQRLDSYKHVAVQINPEANRLDQLQAARRFFESYFQRPWDITIYWGSVEDFIRELANKWAAQQSVSLK